MSDSDSSSSSSSDSSSDDGIFTKPVDLNKAGKVLRTPVTTHPPTSIASHGTPGSSGKADHASSSSRGTHPLSSADLNKATTAAHNNTTASTTTAGAATADARTSARPVRRSGDANTTGLSVAALHAATGTDDAYTPHSTSTNTEFSSSLGAYSCPATATAKAAAADVAMDGHKRHRRRRPITNARPPLHTKTLIAVADADGGDDAAGRDRLLTTTPSPTSDSGRGAGVVAGSAPEPPLPRRRSPAHSASMGDLVTAASLISAANDVPAMNAVHSPSPHTMSTSGRRHPQRLHPHRRTRTTGSSSLYGASPHLSTLAAAPPVVAHLLSDEAYLDTFKIPALIAQLSLSVMAAKPVDLRAFTRDWLADRLVSEEDEDDNAGDDRDDGVSAGRRGSASVDADFAYASSVAATGQNASLSRTSDRTDGWVGVSSRLSDLAAFSSDPHLSRLEGGGGLHSSSSSGSNNSNSSGRDSSSERGQAATSAVSPSAKSAEQKRRSSVAESTTRQDGGAAGSGDKDDDGTTTTTRGNAKAAVGGPARESPPELPAATTTTTTVVDRQGPPLRRGAEDDVAQEATPSRHRHPSRSKSRAGDDTSVRGGYHNNKNKNNSGDGGGGSLSARTTALTRDRSRRRVAGPRRKTTSPSRPLRHRAEGTHRVHNVPPSSSSPNRSIMKTMSPQEVSNMSEDKGAERTQLLADMAEAAFLHEAEKDEAKARTKKRAARLRRSSTSAAVEKTARDSRTPVVGPPSPSSSSPSSSASSSSSSSSGSFFDSPAVALGGWGRATAPPAEPACPSSASTAAGHSTSDSRGFHFPLHEGTRRMSESADELPLAQPPRGEMAHDAHSKKNSTAVTNALDSSSTGSSRGNKTPPNVSCLTEPDRTGTADSDGDSVDISAGRRSTGRGVSSRANTASLTSVTAALAQAGKRRSVTSQASVLSTLGPEPDPQVATAVQPSLEREDAVGGQGTPPPPSSSPSSAAPLPLLRATASRGEGSTADPPPPAATVGTAVTPDGVLKSSLQSSSSSEAGDDDTASFALFAPLLAVNKDTNEVIDYRTHVGSVSGQSVFPGGPPLSVPSGGISRMATPPIQSAAAGHLTSSSSFGTGGTSPSAAAAFNAGGNAPSLSGGAGLPLSTMSPHTLPQTHVSTLTGAPSAFPTHAPRPSASTSSSSAAFNILPTPMLADMVGGGSGGNVGGSGVANSSFSRRAGVQNASFGRRGAAASAATAALSRQREAQSSPSPASAAPPPPLPFLTPHEAGNIGMPGDWKSEAGLQLAGFPKLPAHGAGGVGVAEAVRPTAFCASPIMQGRPEVSGRETAESSDVETTASSRHEAAATTTAASPLPTGGLAGASSTSPLTGTLRIDAARRLGKLMDQLPSTKYAAAIVFLEGLLSSSASVNDGDEVSGSDVQGSLTTLGAASSRSAGRLALTDPLLMPEPGSGSLALSGKPLTPLTSTDAAAAAHAWPMSRRRESSPLGGVPAHGVPTFAEMLGRAAGHGGPGGVGGSSNHRGVTAVHADAAHSPEGAGAHAKGSPAGAEGKTAGSAAVAAIVRDALSQSVLRTLPQTHAGVDAGAGAAHPGSSTAAPPAVTASPSTTTTTTTTTGNVVTVRGLDAGIGGRDHMPRKALTLSTMRLDGLADPPERRLSASASGPSFVSATATAAAGGDGVGGVGAVRRSGPGSLPAASVRSNTFFLPHAASQPQLGGAASFYKKPSGNDLSSMCPYPSAEELSAGSPVAADAPGCRHAEAEETTSKATTKTTTTTTKAAAAQSFDLQAVSQVFATALSSTGEVASKTILPRSSTLPPMAALQETAEQAASRVEVTAAESTLVSALDRDTVENGSGAGEADGEAVATAERDKEESGAKEWSTDGTTSRLATAPHEAQQDAVEQHAQAKEQHPQSAAVEGVPSANEDAKEEEEGKEQVSSLRASPPVQQEVSEREEGPTAKDEITTMTIMTAAAVAAAPQLLPSILSVEPDPTTNVVENAEQPTSPNVASVPRESHSEAPGSSTASCSVTLPAGADRTHSKPGDHSDSDSDSSSKADATTTAAAAAGDVDPLDKKDGDLSVRPHTPSAPRQPKNHPVLLVATEPHSPLDTHASVDTAATLVASVNSTERPALSDLSRHPPTMTTATPSDSSPTIGGHRNSSSLSTGPRNSPPLAPVPPGAANATSTTTHTAASTAAAGAGAGGRRGSAKKFMAPLLRLSSPKSDAAHGAADSTGSWSELYGHGGHLARARDGSASNDVLSPPSRRHSSWQHSPPFLRDGHHSESPPSRSGAAGYTSSSPPPPPLPDAVASQRRVSSSSNNIHSSHAADALRAYEDDLDFGTTLRTAVVMAAATGSHVPKPRTTHHSGSFASSPFYAATTPSSSQFHGSFASGPFSPDPCPTDGADISHAAAGATTAMSTTPVSLGSQMPQSAMDAAAAAAATAAPQVRVARPSTTAATAPPSGTPHTSAAADGTAAAHGRGGGGGGSSSTTPPGVAGLASPTNAFASSFNHSPAHEALVTSSVAAAMNSFLSREGKVAADEIDVVREAVAHFDAFAALDETQLETLVRTMARLLIPEGQTLVQEGEPTLEKLMLVVSGKLSIFRKGLVTRSYTRGQFYGEMEMSYHVERSRVTLTATAPTVVYALSKEAYQKLVIHEKDARRYMFLQYVNQCELFKGLSPPTKMRLADSFRVCRLREGAKLTEQGSPVQWLYLIMSGSVHMTCRPLAATATNESIVSDRAAGMRKAITADSDIAAAAANASHAIVEVLSTNNNTYADPAMLASISSTTQGHNSSSRPTNLTSPPFTPFHRPSALTMTPEGKPGSGVPELLQLAESKAFSAELRKSSGSMSASPLHLPHSQPGAAPPAHLGSRSREDAEANDPNSSSQSHHLMRFLSSGDGVADKLRSTPVAEGGTLSTTSRSEERSTTTHETSTPQRHRQQQQQQGREHRGKQRSRDHSGGGKPKDRKRSESQRLNPHYVDSAALHTPGSLRARPPPQQLQQQQQPSSTKLKFASLGSTTGSLDLLASLPLRGGSPSPSATSASLKAPAGTPLLGRTVSASGNAGSFTAATMYGVGVGLGSPRLHRTAVTSSSTDGSPRPEDAAAVVVVDRGSGQLVGEPEFVFKCRGLFTAVAATHVQAARISRLHFEAVMSRSVVDELKRSMLLNPDYYYFESTVPEELKQEMRRMLFRLNVAGSHSQHQQQQHHSAAAAAAKRRSQVVQTAAQRGSRHDSSEVVHEKRRHTTWSRLPSTVASPTAALHQIPRFASRDSMAFPCSPTANSQSRQRVMRAARGRREGTGSAAEEEMASVQSPTGTRPRAGRERRHRPTPLEPSPTPNSEGRGLDFPAGSPREHAQLRASEAAAGGGRFLLAPAVSGHQNTRNTYSSIADLGASTTTAGAALTVEEGSTHFSVAGPGGSGSRGAAAVGSGGGDGVAATAYPTSPGLAGRSRALQRHKTMDNVDLSVKHSSTAGSRPRRISARGEIVFSGSRNLYRFTAEAMELNQSIVIAVVVDGTIIRWNSVAQSVTGYAPFEAIGKSIYDFIASEEGRQQMRDVLAIGAHYAGKWEQYVEQHLQENRVFPFRQNTGLYQVGLALSVVPSNYTKTAEVLLLVGREGKYRAANTYASDVARWLEGSLKPQLRQFQRRMVQIESHGWRVTSEDALQVKGNLDACLSMVEQFNKFSLLNMEAVNESWRPVRLPALLRRFAVEASTFARQRRHEYYCNIEMVEPKTEIFFDAPQMLAILRLLLADAFMSPNEDQDGNPRIVHAELRVTVVEPQDSHGSAAGLASSPSRSVVSALNAASPSTAGVPGFGVHKGNTNNSAATTTTAAGAAAATLPSHPHNAGAVMFHDPLKTHPPAVGETEEMPTFTPLYTTHTDPPPSRVSGAEEASPGETPDDTSVGNTPPSVNAAASARWPPSSSASGPQSSRAATTGSRSPPVAAGNPSPVAAATPAGAGTGVAAAAAGAAPGSSSSPTTGVAAALSSSSLRRIRFELRDDGPTIPALRSPEAVATESMRAAAAAVGGGNAHLGGSGTQASPVAANQVVEGFRSVASAAALDSSRHKNLPPTASTTANANGGNSTTTTTAAAVGSSRGAELRRVEQILSNLGGTVYGFTRPEAAGNVVRVELPLLAVPGASEDGRDEEAGAAAGGGGGGGGGPVAGCSRTFTVIVADSNRLHQQHMCQILWARQHAVVPVTSFRDLIRKLEMNTADILLIDPLQIDVSTEDYESTQGEDPFDEICLLSSRLALVVMTSDFSDWRVQKLLNRHAVVELPKVGSGALVHIAMQEAEQLVSEMRDEEERIDLIRRTFTNCSAERHKIGQRIGKGAFGDVYEVEDTLTGGKMAMKRMRLHDGLLADEVVQEILAMTTLKHENIIQYFYCEKESDTQLRLYMELAPGGTLRDKIREHPGVGLPFEDVVHHLSDICHGLAYVHEQSYVHGDLKTANLLLGTRGRTKIGDFGTAKHLAPHQQLYTMVGTPQYMAPEVLNADLEQRLGYDFKADIWSLGCIVLEMATGSAPFAHLECAQGMGIIKYLTELTDTPDLSPLFAGNPLVYEFVKSCLDVDPSKRPTAMELLHFDILEGAVASQRAERLVRRAEMLYKLNKYAAMRADGGGSGGGAALAGGDSHSGSEVGYRRRYSRGNIVGDGDGFFSDGDADEDGDDLDSNATEDYDYYGEGELSEESNYGEEEEEEGEYTDEDYDYTGSSRSSDSQDGDEQTEDDAFYDDGDETRSGGRSTDGATTAVHGSEEADRSVSAEEPLRTQSTQSMQEHVRSPVDFTKTRTPAVAVSEYRSEHSPLTPPPPENGEDGHVFPVVQRTPTPLRGGETESTSETRPDSTEPPGSMST